MVIHDISKQIGQRALGKICARWHLAIGIASTNNISLSLCCRVVKNCEDET